MKKGDRVSFNGRTGTIEGFMPAGMVDVRFDDSAGRVERRHHDRLDPIARTNSGRRPRRARRNSDKAKERERQRAAETKMRQTTKAKPVSRQVDVKGAMRGRGAAMFTREDPPRMSADRKSYCGNPIDGTAYYIMVESKKRWVPHWITKAEVRAAAQAAGLKEGTQEFLDWFRDVFVANINAARGTEVIPTTVGPRKFHRLRGGKRGARSQKQLLKDRELLIKQAKAGPSGSEPVPETDFSLVDPETGEHVFFRISRWAAPGPDKLRRFAPFAYRRLLAPALNTVPKKLVKRWGPFPAALHIASLRDRQLQPLGIHPEVAQWLIEAGAVAIGTGRRAYIETRPDADNFEAGDVFQIRLKDKGSSPFFSWVPAVVPLADRSVVNKMCLSGDDLKVRKELRTLSNVLGQFEGALGRVRSIFRRLNEEPTALRLGHEGDVPQAVNRIARAYAALIRWQARQEERQGRGDLVAHRVLRTFGSTLLDPLNPASAYQAVLKAFRTTRGMTGLVPAGWVHGRVKSTDPAQIASTLGKMARRAQRQGADFEVVDPVTGQFRMRSPETELQTELRDRHDYRDFMNGLKSRILAMRSPTTQAKVKVGTIGGEQQEVEAQVRVLPQPGKSALLFFEGEQKPLPHPMDDLFVYITPSLDPTHFQTLTALRKAAEGQGIEMLLRARPRRARGGQWRGESGQEGPVAAAQEFRDKVGLYAQGGVRTPYGRVDPYDRKAAFDLTKPPGWPTSLEEQVDANWAIALVVGSVYPALVWGEGVKPSVAAGECRDLLLLAKLYEFLGGYQLVGPLNPLEEATMPPFLPRVRQQIRDAEAELLGGSRDVSGSDGYRTYKTYNPVLFELTRLFWPSREAGDAEPDWSSILAHPKEMANLDAVGRYGHAAYLTQYMTLHSRSEAEVSHQLLQALSPALGHSVSDMVRGITKDESGQVVPVPEGAYAPFLLNWPLGMDLGEAGDAAGLWIRDPLAYLKTLKEVMQQAVPRLMVMRRVGLPGADRPPRGDLPFLFRGQAAIQPTSSLHKVELARRDQDMDAMVREIDKAIEALERKMGGTK